MFSKLTAAQARKLWLMLGKAQGQCAAMIVACNGRASESDVYRVMMREFREIRASIPVSRYENGVTT